MAEEDVAIEAIHYSTPFLELDDTSQGDKATQNNNTTLDSITRASQPHESDVLVSKHGCNTPSQSTGCTPQFDSISLGKQNTSEIKLDCLLKDQGKAQVSVFHRDQCSTFEVLEESSALGINQQTSSPALLLRSRSIECTSQEIVSSHIQSTKFSSVERLSTIENFVKEDNDEELNKMLDVEVVKRVEEGMDEGEEEEVVEEEEGFMKAEGAERNERMSQNVGEVRGRMEGDMERKIDGKEKREMDRKEKREMDGKEKNEMDGKEKREMDGKGKMEIAGEGECNVNNVIEEKKVMNTDCVHSDELSVAMPGEQEEDSSLR